jgi:ribosomal protein L2
MPVKRYRPTSRRSALHHDDRLRHGISRRRSPRSRCRGQEEAQRPQQQRSHHRAPQGRRHAASVSHHRFQAPEGRDSGEGRGDRVRSQPLGPHRAAQLRDGEKRYILAPVGLEIGSSSNRAKRPTSRPATALPIKNIPLGTVIHNIELRPGEGGKLVRSAGSAAQLMAKEGDYAQVRMPSGEVRKIRWFAARRSASSATSITRTS